MASNSGKTQLSPNPADPTQGSDSDKVQQARAALKQMLHVKKRKADEGAGLDSQRYKKSKESSVPPLLSICQRAEEKKKDVEMSAGINESSFVCDWGLRNDSAVVSSGDLSLSWSQGCITPRDRLDLVDNTPVDVMRCMGAQSIAAANIYFQCSLKHLDLAEKAMIEAQEKQKIAEEDRDTWRFRYDRSEIERVEAQQEVTKLRRELAQAEKLAIERYHKSPGFQAFLDARDHDRLSTTFTACWLETLEKIKKKRPEINLEGINPESSDESQDSQDGLFVHQPHGGDIDAELGSTSSHPHS